MSGTAITESAEIAAAQDNSNDSFRRADHVEGGRAGSVAGDGEDDPECDDGDGGGSASPSAGYQPLWVRLACIGLDFLTQTYDQIRIVPEIVLFEQYVCRSYQAGGGHGRLPDEMIPHELCKSPDVQYQLARLRSYKALFDGIASRLDKSPPTRAAAPWQRRQCH
jgi:hypothetical protein